MNNDKNYNICEIISKPKLTRTASNNLKQVNTRHEKFFYEIFKYLNSPLIRFLNVKLEYLFLLNGDALAAVTTNATRRFINEK